jgi:hypothetical protein
VDGWDESEKVRDEKYEREGRGMSSCGDEEYEFVQVKK